MRRAGQCLCGPICAVNYYRYRSCEECAHIGIGVALIRAGAVGALASFCAGYTGAATYPVASPGRNEVLV